MLELNFDELPKHIKYRLEQYAEGPENVEAYKFFLLSNGNIEAYVNLNGKVNDG